MQSIIIRPNQAGQRFDKFLQKFLPEAQTSFLYKMLRKKNITLNGKKAEGKELLKEGDEVKLFFSDETFQKFIGANQKQGCADAELLPYKKAFQSLKGITVIYEDNHVLALNKPVGILTQKASPSDLSLNEWMIGYLLSTGEITPEELATFRPSVVNRLDRNTSGLVLCGKSLAGSQALSAMIHDRTVRKFYRTIVCGGIHHASSIEAYLIKDNSSNQVTVLHSDASSVGSHTAKNASCEQAPQLIRTAYSPLKHVTVSDRSFPVRNYTYLEVELITGKTHQIRAHLASEGYPLIGDYKYGNRAVNDAFKRLYGLQAQLLHAYRLEFPIGCNGALRALAGKCLEAPLTVQFQKILQDLEG